MIFFWMVLKMTLSFNVTLNYGLQIYSFDIDPGIFTCAISTDTQCNVYFAYPNSYGLNEWGIQPTDNLNFDFSLYNISTTRFDIKLRKDSNLKFFLNMYMNIILIYHPIKGITFGWIHLSPINFTTLTNGGDIQFTQINTMTTTSKIYISLVGMKAKSNSKEYKLNITGVYPNHPDHFRYKVSSGQHLSQLFLYWIVIDSEQRTVKQKNIYLHFSRTFEEGIKEDSIIRKVFSKNSPRIFSGISGINIQNINQPQILFLYSDNPFVQTIYANVPTKQKFTHFFISINQVICPPQQYLQLNRWSCAPNCSQLHSVPQSDGVCRCQKYFEIDSQLNNPLCVCAKRSFYDGISCVGCTKGCTHCTSYENCLSCQTGYTLSQNICTHVLPCQPTQFLYNNLCYDICPKDTIAKISQCLDCLINDTLMQYCKKKVKLWIVRDGDYSFKVESEQLVSIKCEIGSAFQYVDAQKRVISNNLVRAKVEFVLEFKRNYTYLTYQPLNSTLTLQASHLFYIHHFPHSFRLAYFYFLSPLLFFILPSSQIWFLLFFLDGQYPELIYSILSIYAGTVFKVERWADKCQGWNYYGIEGSVKEQTSKWDRLCISNILLLDIHVILFFALISMLLLKYISINFYMMYSLSSPFFISFYLSLSQFSNTSTLSLVSFIFTICLGLLYAHYLGYIWWMIKKGAKVDRWIQQRGEWGLQRFRGLANIFYLMCICLIVSFNLPTYLIISLPIISSILLVTFRPYYHCQYIYFSIGQQLCIVIYLCFFIHWQQTRQDTIFYNQNLPQVIAMIFMIIINVGLDVAWTVQKIAFIIKYPTNKESLAGYNQNIQLHQKTLILKDFYEIQLQKLKISMGIDFHQIRGTFVSKLIFNQRLFMTQQKFQSQTRNIVIKRDSQRYREISKLMHLGNHVQIEITGLIDIRNRQQKEQIFIYEKDMKQYIRGEVDNTLVQFELEQQSKLTWLPIFFQKN